MSLLDTTNFSIEKFTKSVLVVKGGALDNKENLKKVSFTFINKGENWIIHKFEAYDDDGIAYKLIYKHIK